MMSANDNRHYRATPMGIAKMLGVELYPWQAKALADCMIPGQTALCAANESGKTTRVAAMLVLWFFLAFPRGKCVMTSGSWLQVETQLFPAISAYKEKFEGWTFNRTDFTTKKGGRCIAFSTSEPGRFEGHHSDGPDSPLLIILDESKTIPDGIMEAVERCRPQYLLSMSSSGLQRGFFYRAFTADAKFWRRHTITAKDCPHISQASIDRLIEKYKIDNPLIRSMLFSEFVDEANGMQTMIPLSLWNSAIRSKPLKRIGGQSVTFMDFAAGGDENVLFSRHGNVMRMVDAWREKNTSSAVGRFIILLNRCKKEIGLQPGGVFGDGSGLGIPFCNDIGEGGWEVHKVNNGSSANDSEHFCNRAAEMWFECKQLLTEGKLYIEEDDPILAAQITSRHFGLDLKGRIKLEEKSNLRESPDRADAFIGAAVCTPIQPFSYLQDPAPYDEPELESEESNHIPGAYAGI